MRDDDLNRRQIVTAAGTAMLTALAGCTGGNEGSNNSSKSGNNSSGNASSNQGSNSNNELITNIKYNKNNLAVTVDTDKDLSGFTLIDSKGSEISSHSLSPGESRGTLSVTSSKSTSEWVSPGSYTINVVSSSDDSDDILQEKSVELKPEVNLSNIELVTKDPKGDYEDENSEPFYSTVRATIENTGTLATELTYAGLPQGVLEPTDPPGGSGPGGNIAPPKTLSPNSTKKIKVSGSPLRYVGSTNTPGAKQTVVEGADWEDAKGAWCNGKTSKAKLVIKGSNIDNISAKATLKFGGEPTRRDATELDIGCTDVTVVDSWTQNGSELKQNDTSSTTSS